MMTEFHDPSLESLFSEANRELEGDAITAQVMAQTRNRMVTMLAGGLTVTAAVLLGGWYLFSLPLLEFAILVSQFLTNPLIDLGDGWLTLFATPVNNIASLAIITAKGVLMGWKKLTGTPLLRLP